MALLSYEHPVDFGNYALSNFNIRKTIEQNNVENGIFYDSDSCDKQENLEQEN